jgi:hypothetical protein
VKDPQDLDCLAAHPARSQAAALRLRANPIPVNAAPSGKTVAGSGMPLAAVSVIV